MALKSILRRFAALRFIVNSYRAYTHLHCFTKYKIKLVTLSECSKIKKEKLIGSKEVTYHAPTFEGDIETKEIKTFLNDVYILNIENACVIGDSNIIILNDKYALYNSVSGDNIKPTDNALNCYKEKIHLGENHIYIKRYSPKKDTAISFVINFSSNYFHFVYECMTKFYLLNKCNIPQNIPILLDASVKQIPQFYELFSALNTEKRETIFVEAKEVVPCSNLIAFTPIHILPPNFINLNLVDAGNVVLNLDSLLFIRNQILHQIENKKQNQRNVVNDKIYISRKNYKSRTYNDAEVSSFLKEKNFNIISPEDYSVEEQIYFFRNAKIIVAATGAALTNIIFCQPGTTIIVLIAHKLQLPFFSFFAEKNNCNLIYLTGKPETSDLHTTFTIELSKLKNLLD